MVNIVEFDKQAVSIGKEKLEKYMGKAALKEKKEYPTIWKRISDEKKKLPDLGFWTLGRHRLSLLSLEKVFIHL